MLLSLPGLDMELNSPRFMCHPQFYQTGAI